MFLPHVEKPVLRYHQHPHSFRFIICSLKISSLFLWVYTSLFHPHSTPFNLSNRYFRFISLLLLFPLCYGLYHFQLLFSLCYGLYHLLWVGEYARLIVCSSLHFRLSYFHLQALTLCLQYHFHFTPYFYCLLFYLPYHFSIHFIYYINLFLRNILFTFCVFR